MTTTMDSTKLASLLASRVFHDLVSPLTALMNGCAFAYDEDMGGGAMKVEGEKLIKDGTAGLNAKMQFMRYSIGSQGMTDSWAEIGKVKELFQLLFSTQKSTVTLKFDTLYITGRQMRVLMNMALILIDAIQKTGEMTVSAREEGGDVVLECVAIGTPGDIKREVHDWLNDREPDRGWGAAILPIFTRMIADEAGMSLTFKPVDGGVSFIARGPKNPG